MGLTCSSAACCGKDDEEFTIDNARNIRASFISDVVVCPLLVKNVHTGYFDDIRQVVSSLRIKDRMIDPNLLRSTFNDSFFD